jgi:hypothetical protein
MRKRCAPVGGACERAQAYFKALLDILTPLANLERGGVPAVKISTKTRNSPLPKSVFIK